MKRYDGRTKPIPRNTAKKDVLNGEGPRKLLVRATLKNQKISTVVPADKVGKFQDAYCKLLRNNMDGLKKEKKKKKNVKAKTAEQA